MDFNIIKEKRFQYVEKGEGPVILLLHGLFGALSNFKDVINHFSKDYKVVIPLLPIYSLPVFSTNVVSLAKYVHRFIEHKKFEKVNLVGNSLGGHIALVYSLKHPLKVNTMTLTGSSGLYENALGGSFPKREDYNYIKEKVKYTFYNPEHATPALVDEVYGIINDKSKLIRVLSLAKSAIRHNMAHDLEKYKMDVCLIWGKNDTITPPPVAEEFHYLLPSSELFWIDQCGHAAMMEKSEEFNNILSTWLDKKVLNKK
ncbi:MAG: alpha/beta hydrolase [Bacteroidetes bacterium]|nr:alpha/beta hydrolase [Bacteroidota bacterium]HET6245576.1 alpha/beta hydrolase [Bacteroidia bacterium]